MTQKTDRARAAEAMMAIPLFNELMDDLEQAAINQAIFADINDDETRRNAASEARAIKKFRSRLEAISQEGQSKSRTAPA